MSNNHPNVGIVCSNKMGDALLLLVLANNLSINSYDVTIYSDFLFQIKDYIRNVSVKPLPDNDIIQDHDEVLYDKSNPIFNPDGAICYSLTKGEPSHVENHYQRITKKYSGEKLNKLLPFANCNRMLRDKSNQHATMVEHMVYIAKDVLKCANIEKDLNLTVANTTPKSKQVVIHPTSTTEIKNWPPEKFLLLASRFKEAGYQVSFTVAENEREVWLDRAKDRFDVPLFSDIKVLTDYYTESSLFIGNDSGNAHLAAALNIPTFVIINRRKKFYRWRPGWGQVHLIFPVISKYFVGKKWVHFLSVNSVYQTVIKHLNGT